MDMAIAAGMLLFLCPSLFLAYRLGLKDGMRFKEGATTLTPIPTPIQFIESRKAVKAEKVQADLTQQGIVNLFAYDGKPQAGGE